MSEAMRQLASTLIAAANTADENKKLRRQIEEFERKLDTDKQRQDIRRLELEIQELNHKAKRRDEKIKRLTQDRGDEKHRADMLEVKVQNLERKAAVIKEAIGDQLKLPADK